MVTGRCDIRESMDLAANSGLIVSVIKREDPMGNTGRWFVDAGGKILSNSEKIISVIIIKSIHFV